MEVKKLKGIIKRLEIYALKNQLTSTDIDCYDTITFAKWVFQ